MFALQLIIIAIVAVAVVATYLIMKSRGIAMPDIALKVLSGILGIAFFFRYMLADSCIMNIFELGNSPFDSDALTILSLITNWMWYSIIVLFAMFPYFKTPKTSVLVKYYGLAVVLLYIISLKTATIGICGADVYQSFDIRALLIAIEIGVVLSVVIIELLKTGLGCDRRHLVVLAGVPVMLLAVLPGYMLQALFGEANYSIALDGFTFPHRLIIYGAIILPILMYLLLKGREKETVRGILLYICLGVLISFSTHRRFDEFAQLSSWPLHLCHTAMYVMPICIIFRLKKVFYFTYFINVFGALIALLMPSYASGANLLATSVVRFYMVHYMAFFMPLLLVALGVFERPKLQQFKYSMIGFAVYFVVILFVNAYCTNFDVEVDFFYVNGDYIISKIGSWSEFSLEYIWQFNIGELSFVFYPIYQIVFFLVYVVLGCVMWFLYEGMYSFEDTLLDIFARKKAIKADRLALEISLAGRSMEEPMNIDTADKLILDNFSKRYGKSSNYAVKDASLEVCAGDVFGFLGHNGAGKSTIIKSIVGIQPITSGRISVCGYDVDKQSVNAKRCIGFVPDHYALYERLTGREYLNYIADLYDVSNADRDDCIAHYVELFQLQGAIDNQIKTYSHGMKQKVTIMSALIHNPKVWILDEPLTGLDPDSIYQVKQCLKEHAAKGNIVFFSSHLIDIVETVCTKIAIIAQGKILTCDNVEDVVSQGSLEQYYRTVTHNATSAGIDMAGNLVGASK